MQPMNIPPTSDVQPQATAQSSISAQVNYFEHLRKTCADGYGCDEFVLEQLEAMRHYCMAHRLDFLQLLARANRSFWHSLKEVGWHKGATPTAELHIGADDWELDSLAGKGSYRFAWLKINGVDYHLEAIEVRPGAPGERPRAVDPLHQRALDHFVAMTRGVGQYQHMKLEGHQYLLFMSPYCRDPSN